MSLLAAVSVEFLLPRPEKLESIVEARPNAEIDFDGFLVMCFEGFLETAIKAGSATDGWEGAVCALIDEGEKQSDLRIVGSFVNKLLAQLDSKASSAIAGGLRRSLLRESHAASLPRVGVVAPDSKPASKNIDAKLSSPDFIEHAICESFAFRLRWKNAFSLQCLGTAPIGGSRACSLFRCHF